MMDEYYVQLKKTLEDNFPILVKLNENSSGGMFSIEFLEGNLCLQNAVDNNVSINLEQQDCLELSQLFALLATCFTIDEEIKPEEE